MPGWQGRLRSGVLGYRGRKGRPSQASPEQTCTLPAPSLHPETCSSHQASLLQVHPQDPVSRTCSTLPSGDRMMQALQMHTTGPTVFPESWGTRDPAGTSRPSWSAAHGLAQLARTLPRPLDLLPPPWTLVVLWGTASATSSGPRGALCPSAAAVCSPPSHWLSLGPGAPSLQAHRGAGAGHPTLALAGTLCRT